MRRKPANPGSVGLLGGLLMVLAAPAWSAEALPEPVEGAVAEPAGVIVHEGDAAARDGFDLDESIFTGIEAYTVPAVPIALPEDQQEE